ncbi:hypothetical protein GCM10010124_10240 [Pilimelia terevasa]|uniref:CopC domain-containing protein n=1 Tax=Pilimelia terevasa TaxID=53372 RepID=A0A8J3BG48_9ACTN|nr:copper resistance CopC family protein [Pilimelia terevasa]GGK19567.1 hypothetical protein GCM10010124_10240 [Pilimelia terevasa]
MNNLTRTAARIAAVLAAATLGLATTAAPALAHNELTSSSPKNKKTVHEAPENIKLTFRSTLDAESTTVKLVGPDDAEASEGEPRFVKNAVYLKLRPTAAGTYTASYALVSDDGDPVKGKVTFKLSQRAIDALPAPEPTATVEPSAAPEPVVGSDPLVAAGGTAAPRIPTSSGFNWWWVVGGAVVLVLLGLMEAGRRARREA